MEQIRSAYIRVYVDTNKRTIDRRYPNVEEMRRDLEGVEIMGTPLADILKAGPPTEEEP
jgi:hypothetical protein